MRTIMMEPEGLDECRRRSVEHVANYVRSCGGDLDVMRAGDLCEGSILPATMAQRYAARLYGRQVAAAVREARDACPTAETR